MNHLAAFYLAMIRLEVLMRSGMEDSKKADEQREDMDWHWTKMDEKDRALGREFSVELSDAMDQVCTVHS